MKNFKVGEKVIALTNSKPGGAAQPRVKGQTYTILGIMFTQCCGVQIVNISTEVKESNRILCEKCNFSMVDDSNRGWTSAKHFTKPEELQSELDKAIEDEDYEKAATIRDTLGYIAKELIKVSPQT